MKTLSVVVPCYNSADYMRRCLDSVLTAGNVVEVIIVDDGSTDETGVIADDYAARFPGTVRAVHTPNGGHGSAVNTGIAHASGRYVKVVDSDDWVDEAALKRVVAVLTSFAAENTHLDLLVSNFTYEKASKKHKRTVSYRNALPRGRVFGWNEFGTLRPSQYLMMHSLIYRTALLTDNGFRLPDHTFYVDSLYASEPLVWVNTMYYLDVDLYRYFIGRADQSVNEAVMMRRVDQHLRVTNLMQASLPDRSTVHPNLHKYLLHNFSIVSAATSLMLLRSGTKEDIARKAGMWDTLRAEQPRVHRRIRRSMIGRITNLPGPAGRRTTITAYRVARWVVGFN